MAIPLSVAAARSSLPSPLKSPTSTLWYGGERSIGPVGYWTGAAKLPSPCPRKIDTALVPPMTAATSSFLSPLKSPTARDWTRPGAVWGCCSETCHHHCRSGGKATGAQESSPPQVVFGPINNRHQYCWEEMRRPCTV